MGLPGRICVIIAFACQASIAFAGAWPMDKGQGQAILSITQSDGDKLFGVAAQDSEIDVSYKSLSASLYVEHGLTGTLTLGLKTGRENTEFVTAFDRNNYSGISETEFFARTVLWTRKNHILSGQGGIIITPQTDQTDNPNFGQRNVGWELRGLAGTGAKVRGRWGFIEAQIAYRNYGELRPEELRVDLTAGQHIHDNWQIIGQLFTTSSFGELSQPFGYDSNKAQLLLLYDKGYDLSYQFGWQQSLPGRNIVNEDGPVMAFQFRY